MIKYFERSTVERIEENSYDVSRCFIYLYDTHKYGHSKMRNKLMNRKKTTLHIDKDSSSALVNIALEKEEEKKNKKLLQQGVFVFGHPSKYCLRRTGLNFVEQTKSVAVLVVY